MKKKEKQQSDLHTNKAIFGVYMLLVGKWHRYDQHPLRFFSLFCALPCERSLVSNSDSCINLGLQFQLARLRRLNFDGTKFVGYQNYKALQ